MKPEITLETLAHLEALREDVPSLPWVWNSCQDGNKEPEYWVDEANGDKMVCQAFDPPIAEFITELANALPALIAALRERMEGERWRDVEKELPPKSEIDDGGISMTDEVFIWAGRLGVVVARCCLLTKNWKDGVHQTPVPGVTHWMPKPAPPKETE